MLISEGGLDWRKFCGTNNPEKDGCVEFAEQGDAVFLRDSKNPDAGTLSFSRKEIINFVQGWTNQ